MTHNEKRSNWIREGIIMTINGIIFGGTNTLTGHPFDTVKTKMQAHQTSDEAWEWILEHIDQDGSNTVSWGELKGAVEWVCKEHDIGKKECAGYVKEAKGAFKAADTDGSGDIDKAEFEAAWAAYHA